MVKDEQELELFIRDSLPESIDQETCKLHHLKAEEWNSENIEFLVSNIRQLIIDVIQCINTDNFSYPLYIKEPEKITFRDFKIFLRDSNNSHLIPDSYTYQIGNGDIGWINKLPSSSLWINHDIDLSTIDKKVLKYIRTPLEIKKAKESPYGGRKASFLDVRVGRKYSKHTGSYMATVLNYLFIIRLEWQPIESVQWIIDKEDERLRRYREMHPGTRYSK